MKILGIETSCDETSISIIDASGGIKNPKFKTLAHSLISQANLHSQFGGVFPNLAKREHARNLVPVLLDMLKQLKKQNRSTKSKSKKEAGLKVNNQNQNWAYKKEKIKNILAREPELFELLVTNINKIQKPKIEFIAVASGLGLEPALWVGINFALALSVLWNIPVMEINHQEGHVISVLHSTSQKQIAVSHGLKKIKPVKFPAVGLVISGGHTELVLIKKWTKYQTIGQTRDDAVGECFDKVARMLNLPYPGGPEISKLAEMARHKNLKKLEPLPRPMINSKDFDFSYSGLKTAVLYRLQKMTKVTPKDKMILAAEFEDAATDVLVYKTKKALEKFKAKSLIIGGGVIANTHIRRSFETLTKDLKLPLYIPTVELSTDNSIMIAMTGYFQSFKKKAKFNPKIIPNSSRSVGQV